jgi:putative ABC transport system substrate-binding protein
MHKKITRRAFCSMLLALPFAAQAQQAGKIPRIGRLFFSASAEVARMEAFSRGLSELGYVEGKNIVIESRYADGKLDRLPALARELVSLKVDVIVTGGGTATRAAKDATATIPIDMTQDPDPVGSGLVASLARPGGNVTGLSSFGRELSGKRLEILREVIPKLSRVAVLGNSTNPAYPQVMRELEAAAKAFGVKLQYLDVLDSKDIEPAFRAAGKGRANGVLTLPSPVLLSQRTQIVELAVKNRLAAIYHLHQYIEDGGLMYYGVNILDLDRRAATYVDKILKGRTPQDLPVEQPMRFEFIVSLIAAKKIGLTIPPNVLVRADRAIR